MEPVKEKKFETIRAVNFLKGIIVNFDIHKKDDLILGFFKKNKDLIPAFEQANVLGFATRENKSVEKLTELFEKAGYNIANDSEFTQQKKLRM